MISKEDKAFLTKDILRYIEEIQSRVNAVGLIHRHTEIAFARNIELHTYAQYAAEEVIAAIDECVDGYIIGHKRDRAELKNRWALKANGDSIKLVWIDSSERIGIVYHDKIILEDDAWCTCAPGYSNTKMWPLREGCIPVPSKHTLIEALPNPFSL